MVAIERIRELGVVSGFDEHRRAGILASSPERDFLRLFVQVQRIAVGVLQLHIDGFRIGGTQVR